MIWKMIHDEKYASSLGPWKFGEMVFITSEGVEIWLKIKRGTQGKSAMKKMFHKMIKCQD